MSILDRDPKTKDKDYISRLEDFIRSIENKSHTRLMAYFGLKKYIEANAMALSELEVSKSPDAIKGFVNALPDVGDNTDAIDKFNKNAVDFEDKKGDRMLKFAKEQKSLLNDLDEYRKKLIADGVDVVKEEKKMINKSKASVENMMSSVPPK